MCAHAHRPTGPRGCPRARRAARRFPRPPARPGARRARSPQPALAEGPRGPNGRTVPAERRGHEPPEGRARDGGRQDRLTASREVGPASGTRPPPSSSDRTAHRPPRHPSPPLIPLHLSIFLSGPASPPAQLPARAWPRPASPQHTSLATIRPTCRRGHFSTGPRSSYLKRKCHFASLAPGFRLFYASPSQWGGLCIRLRPSLPNSGR